MGPGQQIRGGEVTGTGTTQEEQACDYAWVLQGRLKRVLKTVLTGKATFGSSWRPPDIIKSGVGKECP